MKKGFTLIELLIVIAIIGILATVVILNVTSARVKAQNAKAKEDAATVQKVIGACIADGGTFPVGTPALGQPICSGGNAVVTGNYPTTQPNGWTYSFTGGYMSGVTASTYPPGTPNNPGFACTSTGCTYTGTF